MHHLYVLQSESDVGLYIGYSANLRRRLAEHQTGLSIATSYRGPWRLIYYEAYVEETDARGREDFLKVVPGASTWRSNAGTTLAGIRRAAHRLRV